jgi:hypothetical protein
VNGPLVVAGALALLGAGIHGIGGQLLVVRRLSPDVLPASPFGGPRMTKTMIQAAWHLTTVAFVAVGVALLVSGSVVHGDTARGMAAVGAGRVVGDALGRLADGPGSPGSTSSTSLSPRYVPGPRDRA